MFEITMHQIRRALLRCPACAGERVPDLPPLPSRPTSELVPVAAIAGASRGRYGEDT